MTKRAHHNQLLHCFSTLGGYWIFDHIAYMRHDTICAVRFFHPSQMEFDGWRWYEQFHINSAANYRFNTVHFHCSISSIQLLLKTVKNGIQGAFTDYFTIHNLKQYIQYYSAHLKINLVKIIIFQIIIFFNLYSCGDFIQ